MEIAIIIDAINALLLGALLFMYIQNYRQLKSTFILGLIVFAAFLLIETLTGLYFHLAMIEYYSAQAMDHAFILSLLKLVALAALNWVAWKE